MACAAGNQLVGLYVMNDEVWDDVFGPDARADIERYVTVRRGQISASNLRSRPEFLGDVDVIISSWGGPRLSEDLLVAAPRLRAVFHAAGSVRQIATPELWNRGVVVVSGWQAIAARVAEYTEALVMLALKDFWRYADDLKVSRTWGHRWPIAGTVGSTVGIVSLGAVGAAVCRRLAESDLELVAYDPYADESLAKECKVRLVDLEELFAIADVVTLHTPDLPETRQMVSRELVSSMKSGATLINTARGAVVDHVALAEVLEERPDLFAVLDVTDPEPPPADWSLFGLRNVVLTPHIAGNVGRERRDLGRVIAAEVARYAQGKELRFAVDPARQTMSA